MGDFAIVTLSKPRDATFSGLALAERLKERGLQVIDLRSGLVVHWVRRHGVGTVRRRRAPRLARPMALGLKTDDIARLLTQGPAGEL